MRRRQYGSVFIRVAVIASQTQEMSRNSRENLSLQQSQVIQGQDLGVNGKPICHFLCH